MTEEGRGRLILKAVPEGRVEEAVVVYLAKLYRNAPREKVHSVVKRAPVVLSPGLPARTGRAVAAQLVRLGATAVFVPEPQRPGGEPASTARQGRPGVAAPPVRPGSARWLRAAAAGIFLVAAAVFVYLRFSALFRPPQEMHTRPLAKREVSVQGSTSSRELVPGVLKVPPEKMREALRDAYRLKPDRRFLMAVAETDHFLSGRERGEVAVKFLQGHWVVSYGDTDVGVLPELPDFPDFMNLLEAWAGRLQGEYPLHVQAESGDPVPAAVKAQLQDFLALPVMGALQKLDDQWRREQRHPALLKAATRALVLLNLQMLDRLETADQLTAKALALLALTKSLNPPSVTREESLLAEIMGYSAHAEELAQSLRDADAVRLYVHREDDSLQKLAGAAGADMEARYLWLLRLAEFGEVAPWSRWLSTHCRDIALEPAILKTGLDLQAFELNRSLSKVLPYVLVLELGRETGSSGVVEALVLRGAFDEGSSDEVAGTIVELISNMLRLDISTVLNRFESNLEQFGSKLRGPFLDGKTIRAYYRGYLYSAFSILGLHYLDSLSSVDAANRFAAALGKSDTGLAADLQRWYRNLARSKAGKANLAELIVDLSALTHLGAAPLMRTLEEQKRYYNYGDPTLLKAAKRIVSRMDTRPRHRGYLLRLAYSSLLDLRMAERLSLSLLEMDPGHHQRLRVWHAKFMGDRALLREMLESSTAKAEARLDILGFLEEEEDLDRVEIRNQYRRLLEEAPDSWRVRSVYARFLEEVKAYSEARSVIRDWLAREVTTGGLERIFAHVALARTYEKEGRYREGWHAIEPVASSQQAGAMMQAARLLQRLGREEEAVEMGRAAVSRYVDQMHVRAFLAELYWRQGKFGEAASVLHAAPHGVTSADWQFTVAPAFAAVFMDRPEEEALAAVSALVARGFNHFDLLGLASPIARDGNHQLAFHMVSQLHSGGMGNLVFLIRGYHYLKGWRGKVQALDWLKKQIPLEVRNPASMILYGEGEFDLLWDLIEDPEQGSHPEFVWLMRAAAWLKTQAREGAHREALLDYYEGHREGSYQKIGRYVMGLLGEQEVLSLATDAKKRCEISYYEGLKAEAEGRYEEASDWYRVCIETGLIHNGEYRWAHDTLYRWQTEGKSLSRMASDHGFASRAR